MKKQTKIIAIVLGLVMVAGVAAYTINPELFQGSLRLRRVVNTAEFSEICTTHGFYGIDDLYAVELLDAKTGKRSSRCVADDWVITGDLSGISDIQKKSQEVMFKRLHTAGLNVRAAQLTDDNYLYVELENDNCNSELQNFDPNPWTVGKYGQEVEFKWNGPGCSEYEWSQYELCFKNIYNSQEFACVGVIPDSNYMTLSIDDWEFIDKAMKTYASKKVHTKWYVMSRFGDALNGEALKSEAWRFSYTR